METQENMMDTSCSITRSEPVSSLIGPALAHARGYSLGTHRLHPKNHATNMEHITVT